MSCFVTHVGGYGWILGRQDPKRPRRVIKLGSETPAKLEFYHKGSETDMDEQIPNS